MLDLSYPAGDNFGEVAIGRVMLKKGIVPRCRVRRNIHALAVCSFDDRVCEESVGTEVVSYTPAAHNLVVGMLFNPQRHIQVTASVLRGPVGAGHTNARHLSDIVAPVIQAFG